jgi:ATP/maltotriose-dependent transcriptional regulator MalT
MTDTPATTAALTALATHLAMTGEPAARAAQAAERALAGMAGAPLARAWSEAVRVLVLTERFENAGRELAHAATLDGLALRAALRLRTGDLPRALTDARRAHVLASVSGHAPAYGCAVAGLAEALIERGETHEAADLFEERPVAASAGALPDVDGAECVLLARGRLRLVQGRVGDAVEDLRECGRRAAAAGNLSPAALPWRSVLARALLEGGDVAEAQRLAADELERARRCGTPRVLGIALCAAGLVADEDTELLAEAVAVLEGSAARLELARALAQQGVALRHAGRPLDAREPLRRALDLAHRCGATLLEEHALAELRAAGARPRRRLVSGLGALTPSERRVAELAAAGHMNREIADALYVTLDTVEYHLRHCYRKLGIVSRTGLDAALGFSGATIGSEA